MGLVWKPNASWAHSVIANYIGDRYFGGDKSNSLQKLPGHTTLDWQTRWQMRNWSVTAKLQNLTDKKYSPLGYDYGYGASYYPANPLSAYLTIRHDFQ
jgi:outer membrane receptor protein involved in Fe transport